MGCQVRAPCLHGGIKPSQDGKKNDSILHRKNVKYTGDNISGVGYTVDYLYKKSEPSGLVNKLF